MVNFHSGYLDVVGDRSVGAVSEDWLLVNWLLRTGCLMVNSVKLSDVFGASTLAGYMAQAAVRAFKMFPGF